MLSADLKNYLSAGARIIDVRTIEEFSSGHVSGSINIPLDTIVKHVEELRSLEKIVVCCRSGNRSGLAMQILNAQGFENVINGGSFQQVQDALNQVL